MKSKLVIFDMDGVLIDSEPWWNVAIRNGFRKVGLEMSDEMCEETMGARLNEVVEYRVKKHKIDDIFNFSAEVRSVSEDVSKPIRYTSVRMMAPDTKYTNHQIVIDIPNVRKPIPLFILMILIFKKLVLKDDRLLNLLNFLNFIFFSFFHIILFDCFILSL